MAFYGQAIVCSKLMFFHAKDKRDQATYPDGAVLHRVAGSCPAGGANFAISPCAKAGLVSYPTQNGAFRKTEESPGWTPGL